MVFWDLVMQERKKKSIYLKFFEVIGKQITTYL